MKPDDAEYTALVEQKRAEIRGNISSVKMSEDEIAKEIAEVTEGVFAEREEGNKGTLKDIQPYGFTLPTMADLGKREPIEIIDRLPPRKRGRPLGSKNKPKS